MLTSILVDLLNRSGGRLAMTASYEPVIHDIPEPLASEVRRHAAPLAHYIVRSKGTKWRLCPVCWRDALTTGQARKCFLTAGCKGTMTTVDKVPSPPWHEGKTCARPGCERPGWRSTHWGEVYCASDWHMLALLDTVDEGDHAHV